MARRASQRLGSLRAKPSDQVRRDVRVVEGARLESVCRGNSTVGSNPTLSESHFPLEITRNFRKVYESTILSPTAVLNRESVRIFRRSSAVMTASSISEWHFRLYRPKHQLRLASI